VPDLSEIARSKMTLNQYRRYARVGKLTGHLEVEQKAMFRSLVMFLTFRKTREFKRKSIEELEEYLNHKYFECDHEEKVNYYLNLDTLPLHNLY